MNHVSDRDQHSLVRTKEFKTTETIPYIILTLTSRFSK